MTDAADGFASQVQYEHLVLENSLNIYQSCSETRLGPYDAGLCSLPFLLLVALLVSSILFLEVEASKQPQYSELTDTSQTSHRSREHSSSLKLLEARLP